MRIILNRFHKIGFLLNLFIHFFIFNASCYSASQNTNDSKEIKKIHTAIKLSWSKEGYTNFCPTSIPRNAFSNLEITGIKAEHRNGQTFITWNDAIQGKEGQYFRYSIHRHSEPITQENIFDAKCEIYGVLNNSSKLFGYGFNQKDRLDQTKPTAIIKNNGKPLPMWSGIAVYTAKSNQTVYYAVVATDMRTGEMTKTYLGKNSIATPVFEKEGLIQPIKMYDSKDRGPNTSGGIISGTPNMPLMVWIHGSRGTGGPAGSTGDYYLYFGDKNMGYRDGLQSVFSVHEERGDNYKPKQLKLISIDAIEHPSGKRALESYWFGFYSLPQNSPTIKPFAYPYTENKLLWLIDWVSKKYKIDKNRIHASGGSMGGTGTVSIGLKHPEIFSSIYPMTAKFRQENLPSLINKIRFDQVFLPDGKTNYYSYLDMIEFVKNHPSDLPFIGWAIGRNDGMGVLKEKSWKEQIEMVNALTKGRHGFAFAWNNGGHSEGSYPIKIIKSFYDPSKFNLKKSYPAFSNSSLDDNLGNGDPNDGDLVGGINLGFSWNNVIDEKNIWTVSVGNTLTKTKMSVNITPRRIQKFKILPGEAIYWESSSGDKGNASADPNGILTVGPISIFPEKMSKVIIKKEKF